jgi:hypothetical protein
MAHGVPGRRHSRRELAGWFAQRQIEVRVVAHLPAHTSCRCTDGKRTKRRDGAVVLRPSGRRGHRQALTPSALHVGRAKSH